MLPFCIPLLKMLNLNCRRKQYNNVNEFSVKLVTLTERETASFYGMGMFYKKQKLVCDDIRSM